MPCPTANYSKVKTVKPGGKGGYVHRRSPRSFQRYWLTNPTLKKNYSSSRNYYLLNFSEASVQRHPPHHPPRLKASSPASRPTHAVRFFQDHQPDRRFFSVRLRGTQGPAAPGGFPGAPGWLRRPLPRWRRRRRRRKKRRRSRCRALTRPQPRGPASPDGLLRRTGGNGPGCARNPPPPPPPQAAPACTHQALAVRGKPAEQAGELK